MQEYWIGVGDAAKQVHLPPADLEVIPGVPWGRGDMLDTAAYWALQCITEENPLQGFTSSDGCLLEEIGFCLLGGFGITADLNGEAFKRLKAAGAFDLSHEILEPEIRNLLSEPLLVDGRPRRYRFPNQRARRISAMRLKLENINLAGLTLDKIRSLLVDIDGIGPKTSSWILRVRTH